MAEYVFISLQFCLSGISVEQDFPSALMTRAMLQTAEAE